MTVRLQRLICRGGKSLEFKTCSIKFIARNVAAGTSVWLLKKEMSVSTFSLKTYFKFSNNEFRPMGIDSSFEYCGISNGFYTSPLFNFVKNIIKNYTNIYEKCPVPVGEYYIRNFNFQAQHLPMIVPAGQYLANMSLHIQSNEFLANFLVYFSVTNYGIDQWHLK